MPTSPIRPIRQASAKIIRDSEKMTREALRGHFDAETVGDYLQNGAAGAAGGAAEGAIGGALLGGVTALPGAAAGAIEGGLWGLGSRGLDDAWYATRRPEDKASWQAGDIDDHCQAMASALGTQDSTLNELGKGYKRFIDSYVQNKQADSGGALQSIGQAVLQGAVLNTAISPMSKFLTKNIGKAGEAAVTNPKLWKSLLKGPLGIAANIGVAGGADMAMQGVNNAIHGNMQQVQAHLNDIGKTIQEINGLVGNEAQVVLRGNQLWGALNSAVDQAKAAQTQAAAPEQPAAPQAAEADPDPSAAPAAPVVASKFRRPTR